MLLQLLLNGLISASICSVLTMGFALVYNTTRIFHIAYASLYVVASYVLFVSHTQLNLPVALSVALSLIITAAISVYLEVGVYGPLRRLRRSPGAFLVSSIGIMVIVVNAIALVFGNDTITVNAFSSQAIRIDTLLITHAQLLQLIGCGVVTIVFVATLKYSRFGLEARCLRDDDELCRVFGIDTAQLRIGMFALSGGLVAIGACMVTLDIGSSPYDGMPMLLEVVVALIIGGVGRFGAPVVGSLVVGLLQAIVTWGISARWSDAVAFVLLLVFLLFRPQGILGERSRTV